MQGNDILDVGKITGYLGKWSIDTDGTLIAVKIITNEMIAEKLAVNQSVMFGSSQNSIGLTMYDEVTKEPFCIKMRNGAMVSEAGICGSQGLPQTTSGTQQATSDISQTMMASTTAINTEPASAESTPPTDTATTTPTASADSGAAEQADSGTASPTIETATSTAP